jgi:hypothetical protein
LGDCEVCARTKNTTTWLFSSRRTREAVAPDEEPVFACLLAVCNFQDQDRTVGKGGEKSAQARGRRGKEVKRRRGRWLMIIRPSCMFLFCMYLGDVQSMEAPRWTVCQFLDCTVERPGKDRQAADAPGRGGLELVSAACLSGRVVRAHCRPCSFWPSTSTSLCWCHRRGAG